MIKKALEIARCITIAVFVIAGVMICKSAYGDVLELIYGSIYTVGAAILLFTK